MNIKICLCCLAVLTASACASSPNSHFYMLAPMQEAAVSAPAAADSGVSICVGPVLVPRYLDRLTLCVRDSAHEVTYAEFHRWAEPLEDGISRVLVENLSQLLGTARIEVFPWKTPAQADYQVRIMLIRFDGAPCEQAVLKARWSLSAAGRETPVVDTMSIITEPVESNDYAALVSAQNRALDRLSREIAGAIQQVRQR